MLASFVTYAALLSFAVSTSGQRTLADLCTINAVTAALPSNIEGVSIDTSSVITTVVRNFNVKSAIFQPDSVFDLCNATFVYTHTGNSVPITLNYWLPDPTKFQNRYLSTGGGGYAFNQGVNSNQLGVPYGAVTGRSDAGLGLADNLLNNGYFLLANGTINWERIYTFAYQGHHDMALVGQALTKNLYGMGSTRLYSYYQGCSEGGREGLSQVQNFPTQFDGSIIGAPAIRLPFQQIQHLFSGVAEQTMAHYPPQCAFQKIMNETIKACDPLDGRTDGVVARSDLCILNYDISKLVGASYSCGAIPGTSQQGVTPTPAMNGTLTKQDIALAKKILSGLHNTKGQRAYFTYQPQAYFTDAATAYNTSSGTYYVPADGGGQHYGSGWVAQALEQVTLFNLPTLAGITFDTLVDFISLGLQRYAGTLMTNYPDISDYYQNGGKVLHYHGESDYSIPTASSVRYYESVRKTIYGNISRDAGSEALNDWYRLFLVPGAGHCNSNPYEPNGVFPQTNLQVMINWVEKGVVPITLNATRLLGNQTGSNAQICPWPSRPQWSTSGSMNCVAMDQKSYNTWTYNLNAFNVPIY